MYHWQGTAFAACAQSVDAMIYKDQSDKRSDPTFGVDAVFVAGNVAWETKGSELETQIDT